jgi:hypothetical protein
MSTFEPTPDTRADSITAGDTVYFPGIRRYQKILKIAPAATADSLIRKLESALASARAERWRDARIMAGYAQDDARSLEADSDGKLALVSGRGRYVVAPDELVAVRKTSR